MKKIIIVPYIGRLPNYFQLFLNSCEKNESFNWLVLTDDDTKYRYPNNVEVKYTSFYELKELFQSKFEFPLSLDKPYKFCDFKPAYGYIFSDLIQGYDFWGHCDLDLIFGDLKKFITNEVLSSYDKIFRLGHFTLYRNSDENNKRFMLPLNGQSIYKTVYSNPGPHIFDEDIRKDNININTIYRQYGIPIYHQNICADIYTKSSNFKLTYFDFETDKKVIEKNKKSIFIWDNGKVIRYCQTDGILKTEEYAYIHLQKRNMSLDKLVENSNYYSIIPHSFEPLDEKINLDNFSKLKFKYFNLHYFRLRYKNFRIKLLQKLTTK